MSAAERLVRLLRERGLTVTTAESMTGGLIAGAIHRRPGRQRGAFARAVYLFQRDEATLPRRVRPGRSPRIPRFPPPARGRWRAAQRHSPARISPSP